MIRALLLMLAGVAACSTTPKVPPVPHADLWQLVPNDAWLTMRTTLAQVQQARDSKQALTKQLLELIANDDMATGGFLLRRDAWPGIDADAPLIFSVGRLNEAPSRDLMRAGLPIQESELPPYLYTQVLLPTTQPSALRKALREELKPEAVITEHEQAVVIDLRMPLREAKTPDTPPPARTGFLQQMSPARYHFVTAGCKTAMYFPFERVPDAGALVGAMQTFAAVKNAPQDLQEVMRTAALSLSVAVLELFDPTSREIEDLMICTDFLAAPAGGFSTVLSLTRHGRQVWSHFGAPRALPALRSDTYSARLSFSADVPGLLQGAKEPLWLSPDLPDAPSDLGSALHFYTDSGAFAHASVLSRPIGYLAGLLRLAPAAFQVDGNTIPIAANMALLHPSEGEQALGMAFLFPKEATDRHVDQWLATLRLLSGKPESFKEDRTATPEGLLVRAAVGAELAALFSEEELELRGLQLDIRGPLGGYEVPQTVALSMHAGPGFLYVSTSGDPIPDIPSSTWVDTPLDASLATCRLLLVRSGRAILDAVANAPPDMRQLMVQRSIQAWNAARPCLESFPGHEAVPKAYPVQRLPQQAVQ